MMNYKMLKICADSILKPVELITKSFIESGNFPWNGEKLMLSQFIKKNKQQKTIVRFRCYLFVVRY